MRVTVLELAAQFGDPAAALARVDGLLSASPPGDLVLLPEASLTGYLSPELSFDLTRFAEPLDGPTARGLAALAVKHRCALFGPLVERDGERRYNALLGFDAAGLQILHYRKRHPWYPETWATPGSAPHPLVAACGRQLTCAICFDLHFLEDEAAGELGAAELLLFPSAWTELEGDTRLPALEALARRFQVAVVNANWGPGRPRVPGQGGSAVIDAGGRLLARAAPGVVRLDVAVPSTAKQVFG